MREVRSLFGGSSPKRWGLNGPIFPPVESASPEGIVGIGGELSTEVLVEAYSKGIFPWPHEGLPMLWFCPWERGLIKRSDFHLPRRFRRAARSKPWSVTWNASFGSVILSCAKSSRRSQKTQGTWITSGMITAYQELHKLGYAVSLEVWDESDQLIGGIYAVVVGGVVSAESMFHERPDASKVALSVFCQDLFSLGIEWVDTQMVTPVVAQFGASLVSQSEHQELLKSPGLLLEPRDWQERLLELGKRQVRDLF